MGPGCEQPADGYTGLQVLEVMAEAVNYNRWLCDLVISHAPPDSRLLDFGAGTGIFAKAVALRGRSVACVELDDALRTQLRADGLVAIRSLDDVQQGSEGFIYTLNVLEHIEDDQRSLNELARCLRPGGTLLIYVPAFQLLYSAMDRKIGHFRRYRLAKLVRKVESSGLSVTEARYADSLGFLASLLYKWVGSSDGTLNLGALKFYDRVLFPISRLLDTLSGNLFGKNVLVVAKRSR